MASALVFGSTARATAHEASDVDVAIGLHRGTSFTTAELGTLVADLERAEGRSVDLVMLDGAAPALAFRIFRDGRVLVERDHRALADRRARAILDYLDFQPTEAIAIRGVLAAARGR